MKALSNRYVLIFDALYFLVVLGLIVLFLYQLTSPSTRKIESKNERINFHLTVVQLHHIETFNINQICG